MHKEIGRSDIALTPEVVKRFSDMPTFGGDRDRDSKKGQLRVAWLARLLSEGKFHGPVWSTASLNGKEYRVDGGHSSAMLAQANGKFPAGMKATIIRFQCDTDQDMADLFDQFNRQESVRTNLDKVKAHAHTQSEIRDVSPTLIDKSLTGLSAYLRLTGQVKRMTSDDRTRLIHEYPAFIVWAKDFFGQRHFQKGGVGAAIFASWSTSIEAATEFWNLVATESHPENTHQTRVLAKFLRDNHRGLLDKKFDSQDYYRKCAAAWNAWRANQRTELKVYRNSPLPEFK